MPDKPFFMYFAPGATHAPHHVPKEWIEKYKGKFAHGWDKQREITFAKQKALGVIGPDAELTPRHAEIPAWDDMDPALKPVLEREMEVYAAFMEHTDHHVGRLIDTIKDLGVYDDTLVYVIIGDNGASAEGTLQGAFNEMANFNGMGALETPEFMVSKLDEFGSPSSYNHFAVGWAWAMDTPYQWTKQVASHWGGTRNGTIVRYPKLIKDKGGVRNQFSHVIDVAPTILEVAGIPEPIVRPRRPAEPVRGHEHGLQLRRRRRPRAPRSPVLRDVRQPRHLLQGLERRHQAQDAVDPGRRTADRLRRRRLGAVRRQQRTGPRPTTCRRRCPTSSMSSSGSGSSRRPATTCCRSTTVASSAPYPEIAGRPTLIQGNSQLLFAGMGRLSENSVVSIKNKSFSVTANVDVPEGGAEGTIIAQGGRFGGWALYARDGTAKFVYNVLGIHEFPTVATEPIPAGDHQVRMEFAYDGGGLGKGGTVTLYYDGKAVGTGKVAVHPADGLLGRRDDRCRLRERHRRSAPR